MIPVRITLTEGAQIPNYQTVDAAGADLCAFIDSPVMLAPGETRFIHTGVSIEIPSGYEAQIRPRSGLALKHGITMLNSPGTIDADYRGEIGLIVINLGNKPFEITNGMRIAQMVFNKIFRAHFLLEKSLTDTERSNGGFGHTGL